MIEEELTELFEDKVLYTAKFQLIDYKRQLIQYDKKLKSAFDALRISARFSYRKLRFLFNISCNIK